MATHAYSTPAPEDGAHHRTRRAIEAHIEEMIALLDNIDDDPDLEPDADAEPSLAQTGQTWMGSDDDRELDLDTEEDGEGDREPALGYPEGVQHAAGLVCGQGYCEEEDTAPERHGRGFIRGAQDDREDGGDREPEEPDGSGEFSGGDVRGADEPEVNVIDLQLWRRA